MLNVLIMKELINYLYYGFAAILINKSYYVVEFKRSLDSGINKCENEKQLRVRKMVLLRIIKQILD